MDGVSIAASIISVVVVGLQCIKFIHQTASGIKNGPNAVHKVATASQNLSQFLEQINDLAEQAKETLAGKDIRFLQELQPLLEECVRRLDHIKETLQKFPAASGDHIWNRTKRKTKIYLHEKDFEEMWNVLNHYTQLLGSQLARIDIRLGLLHAEDLQIVGEVVTKGYYEAGRRHEAIISAFDRQHTRMDDLQTRLCEELSMLSKRVQDTLIMSSKQAAALQETKRVQPERIFQDLQFGQQEKPCDWQLFHHSTGLDVKPSGSVFCREHGSDSTNFPKMFNRIGGLAMMKKKELFTSEAQSIISDLVCVIGSIAGNEKSNSRTAKVKGLSLRMQRAAEKTSLHRIQDILRASRGLFIEHSDLKGLKRRSSNKLTFARPGTTKHDCSLESFSASIPIFQLPDGIGALREFESNLRHRKKRLRYVSHDRWPSVTYPGSRDFVSLAEAEPSQPWDVTEYYAFSREAMGGSVVIETEKRLSLDHETASTGYRDFSKEHFSARIKVIPSSIVGLNVQIILDLSQEFTKRGINSFSPSISFRSIIPYGSEIFDIVQLGSVAGLREALASKSASLTDCDPDGRSLLHYAVEALRPSMVRFLVEAGADTNSFEKSQLIDALEPPLLWAHFFISDCTPLEGYLTLKCNELLLANDADPSMALNGREYPISVFENLYRSRTTAMTENLLNLGAPFISPNSTGGIASHPLLILAGGHPIYFVCRDFCEIPDKVALFLMRGANVNVRDSNGSNCLHLVMMTDLDGLRKTSGWHEPTYHNELRDILTLLITAGADVDSVDNDNVSVSDIALRYNHENLWKDVLGFCGYDVEAVCSRESDINHGWSSAVHDSYVKYSARRAPKLSFQAYLAMRKTKNQVTEIFDLEDAEATHVRASLAENGRVSEDVDSDDEINNDYSDSTDTDESDDSWDTDDEKNNISPDNHDEDISDNGKNERERFDHEKIGYTAHRDELKLD